MKTKFDNDEEEAKTTEIRIRKILKELKHTKIKRIALHFLASGLETRHL